MTQHGAWLHGRARLTCPAAVAWLACGSLVCGSATIPLEIMRYSADTSRSLTDGSFAADAAIVTIDPTGQTTVRVPDGLPAEADVDAYHRFPDGRELFSFDTTIELPDGLVAHPADVLSREGSSFALLFAATTAAVPPEAGVDAATVIVDPLDGTESLLISFDVTIEMAPGVLVADEDLVRIGAGEPTLFFDGSQAGVPVELDLNAAHWLPASGRLLVSFDGVGTIGDATIHAADVLEYDSAAATWRLVARQGQLDNTMNRDALHAKALDDDGDGVGLEDCNDYDPDTWALPLEAEALQLSHSGGMAGMTELRWSAPAARGGVTLLYDTLGSADADTFSTAGICIEAADSDTTARDGAAIPAGHLRCYLIRARNSCGSGSLGVRFDGSERAAGACGDSRTGGGG